MDGEESAADAAVGACCCSNVSVGATAQEGRGGGALYRRALAWQAPDRQFPLGLRAPLPVLELPCHALGDAPTHQTTRNRMQMS